MEKQKRMGYKKLKKKNIYEIEYILMSINSDNNDYEEEIEGVSFIDYNKDKIIDKINMDELNKIDEYGNTIIINLIYDRLENVILELIDIVDDRIINWQIRYI